MGKNPYTSSERRGIIAVALVALLILGGGIILSVTGGQTALEEESVIEYPEMVDSVALHQANDRSSQKKSKTKSKRIKKPIEKKTYRKRSPLDEPV